MKFIFGIEALLLGLLVILFASDIKGTLDAIFNGGDKNPRHQSTIRIIIWVFRILGGILLVGSVCMVYGYFDSSD